MAGPVDAVGAGHYSVAGTGARDCNEFFLSYWSAHVTDNQMLSAAEVWLVQVMPSGLVITRLPLPEAATATNVSCPVGPPHVTDNQSLSAAEVWLVQVMPSARTVNDEKPNVVAIAKVIAMAAERIKRVE